MARSSQWTTEVEPARPAQGETPAAGPVYKATAAQGGFPSLQDVNTCYELFQRSVKLYADRPCLGSRKIVDGQAQPYTYITYQEAGSRVSQIGSAMNSVGVQPHTRVGVFGANSPEWMIAMQVGHVSSLSAVAECLGQAGILRKAWNFLSLPILPSW